ncbi:MAG: tetratricopeptide repeat protein [Pirellula sp.]
MTFHNLIPKNSTGGRFEFAPKSSATSNSEEPSAKEQLISLEASGDKAAEEGRNIDALRAYDAIIGFGGSTASIWNKTGNLLSLVGEYAQAIGAFERALEQDATNPATHHNLAGALFALGDLDRSLESLRRAVGLTDQLDPWQGIANLVPNAPMSTNADIFAARRDWATRLAAVKSTSPSGIRKIASSLRENKRPIHVAYLSAHFGRQNYMKPVWGLINRHHRGAFRIDLLSDKKFESPFPGYQLVSSDTVTDVSGLNDQQLAAHVEEREIDVLVDLSAYSHQPRMSFFLQKVAPVTIAWFNMFGTSGFPAFDYIVGDHHVVLPEEERHYVEKVLRLPCSYLTFQVDYPVPDVASPPCLTTGRFTFGSLVSQYKITPPVLDAWSEILKRSPESQLLLANSELKSPHNRSYVLEQVKSRGVASDQLRFLPPVDHDSFLRYYDQIDLALDAFPYNGGTTTTEAIWQGVPVLTKQGDRWAARTSQSLLCECHLSEFVAIDRSGYVDQAVSWATNKSAWSHLSTLRNTMRERLRASLVCDSELLTREMETIFSSCLSKAIAWDVP